MFFFENAFCQFSMPTGYKQHWPPPRRINKKLTRGVLDLFVQHSWRLGYRATGSRPGQFAILTSASSSQPGCSCPTTPTPTPTTLTTTTRRDSFQ